jgi:hypothetical protein
VLSGSQREQIVHALRSAFPDQADFEFMVATKLEEVAAVEMAIVLKGNYRDYLLAWIKQMDARSRLKELFQGALSANPTSVELIKCCADFSLMAAMSSPLPGNENRTKSAGIHAAIQQQTELSASLPPPPALCDALVTLLLRLPGIQKYESRSSLLRALPASHTLDRNSSNTRQDLVCIVAQLAQLGQTSARRWPLLLLFDAALADIQGYTLTEDLQQVRRQLLVHYGVHEDVGPYTYE